MLQAECRQRWPGLDYEERSPTLVSGPDRRTERIFDEEKECMTRGTMLLSNSRSDAKQEEKVMAGGNLPPED